MIVSVRLHAADGDLQEEDAQARELRRDLLLLDIDDVALARGADMPAGARGHAADLGVLLFAVANSTVLVAVCRLLRAWVTRDQGRSATVRYGPELSQVLEISGINRDQHQQIIDAFMLAMHDDLERNLPDAETGADDLAP